MRKTSIAISIAAALTAQAFMSAGDAQAAPGRQAHSRGPQAAHFKTPRAIHPAGSTVLYDQSGTADVGAQVLHDSNSSSYDSEGADDFVVTDAAGWTVSQFNFQTSINSSSPPASPVFDIAVYPDDGGAPGATATCTYPGATGTVDGTWTNVEVALPTPCVLPQGTYWVSYTPNFHFPPQSFWSTLSGATIGGEANWRNPGGAYGTPCSEWGPITSCTGFQTSPIGAGDTNFAFQVIGAVGGGGDQCAPGGICLVTTVGTDTSAGACGTVDTLDVTIGDQVNFCYTVTNNSGVELDYHTLGDNIDGTLFSLLNQPIANGASYQYNRVITAGATETRTSTWTAQDVPPGYASEVTSGGAITDRIFCDGFDGVACSSGSGGFIDITSDGTALGLADDESVAVTLPFSFNLYGTTSSDICIDNNGLILFNTTSCPTSGFYDNDTAGALPTTTLTTPAILPMWDDFDSESGDVYYATRGTSPNRQFIVEWYDRVHYSGATNSDGATFEVILDEATGKVSFEYLDVQFTAGADDGSGGASATIGLQNDPTLANQFSFLEAAVTDNSGIDWTATTPTLYTSTDTTTLNVGAPEINVDPTSLSGTVGAGSSTTTPLDIQNLGNRDLTWTADEAPPDSHFTSAPGTHRFSVTAPNAAQRLLSAAQARPQTGAVKHAGQKTRHVSPLGTTSPAFIIDHNFDTGDNFGSIDAAAPSTFTTIAASPSDLYKTGTFVDNDFSKEYVAAINGAQTIGTLDTATGALTTLPSSSAPTLDGEVWFGLKWDASSGTLFGLGCQTASLPLSCHLYSVDPTTGSVTAGPPLSGVDDPTYGTLLVDIAIDPNGLMYGVHFFTGDLIAIDKTTGVSQSLGTTGVAPAYVQALDFDQATGLLYWASFDGAAGTMYTVSTTDGSVSLVGPLANSDEQYALAIAVPSGPCGQPADQPWLSLGPDGGTIIGGADTPVTVTIDATGHVDGDTLAGTICVRSNDPDERTVPVPVSYTVGAGGGTVAPTLGKAFAPTSVAVGADSTLTITLSNSNATAATLTANLVDTFPSGLVVSSTPAAATTCASGTATASAGGSTVTLGTGAQIPAASSCTVTVAVESAAAGSYTNTLAAGSLVTDAGSNAAPATAGLTVTGGGNPNIIDSGLLNLSIPATSTGLYYNWLTATPCTASCTPTTNYHFNGWANGGNLAFFWPGTNVSMCVSSGASCSVLTSGAVIGPSSTFSEGNSANFVTGGTLYLGFQFVNTNTTLVNYGYVKLTTTGPTTGFPATLVEYWYDNSGAAITIP